MMIVIRRFFPLAAALCLLGTSCAGPINPTETPSFKTIEVASLQRCPRETTKVDWVINNPFDSEASIRIDAEQVSPSSLDIQSGSSGHLEVNLDDIIFSPDNVPGDLIVRLAIEAEPGVGSSGMPEGGYDARTFTIKTIYASEEFTGIGTRNTQVLGDGTQLVFWLATFPEPEWSPNLRAVTFKVNVPADWPEAERNLLLFVVHHGMDQYELRAENDWQVTLTPALGATGDWRVELRSTASSVPNFSRLDSLEVAMTMTCDPAQ